jgi:GGDEF domain-containing protein
VQCRLTISAGVACCPAQPGDRRGNADSLILEADNQLYRAKQEGRNRVVGGITE